MRRYSPSSGEVLVLFGEDIRRLRGRYSAATIGCLHSLFRHVAVALPGNLRFPQGSSSGHFSLFLYTILLSCSKLFFACHLISSNHSFFHLRAYTSRPLEGFYSRIFTPLPLEPLVLFYPRSLRFEPFVFSRTFHSATVRDFS